MLSSSSTARRCRGEWALRSVPFGEVVAQEPVGVLVRAALPWRSGGAEVDRRAERFGDGEVASYLRALVPGDRPQQHRREVAHARSERGVEGVTVALRQMQPTDEAGLVFDQRADRRALVLADEELALPMARLRAIVGWEGSLVDGEHRLFEPGSTPVAALMSAAMVSSRAKR